MSWASANKDLVLLLSVLAIWNVFLGAQSLQPEWIYNKDFIQDYLSSKSLLEGKDPYSSVPELITRYLPSNRQVYLTHPSPHPPFSIIFFVPFSLLPYHIAAYLWFGLQLFCLLLAFMLSSKHLAVANDRDSHRTIWLAFLGSGLLWREFFWGQQNSFLLLLLLSTWICWKKRRFFIAGALLGIAISLKLFLAPLVIFFIRDKTWKSLIGTFLVLLVSLSGPLYFFGPQIIESYFLDIAPMISSLYANSLDNQSLFSVPGRIFEGAFTPLNGHESDALCFWPQATEVVRFIFVALMAGSFISIWRKATKESLFFGSLILLCLFFSPISWGHYYLLTAIPFLLATFENPKAPLKLMYLCWTAIILICFGTEIKDIFMPSHTTLKFFPSLFSLCPLMGGIIGLLFLFLIQKCDRSKPE